MSSFRVLFVCTANYCRSPIAQQLLIAECDRKFGPANSWIVESAGTDVRVVRPMHEFSVEVLRRRSAFVEGHWSVEVNNTMLERADLVLTASREHRAAVVRLLPAAIGRAFTIRQFARLAAVVDPIESTDPGELGRRLLTEAKAARALLQPVSPELDDLPDPMGGPIEGFEACAATLDVSIELILRPLRLIQSVV